MTYNQVILYIDENASQWHDSSDFSLAQSLELNVMESISKFALTKGLDYDIGRFKLSFILNANQKVDDEMLEGCRHQLLEVFIEMLAAPNGVINDYPIKNTYVPLKFPDLELVALSKYFYAKFWNDERAK
ncbi:MAG TPA: hypothetical protein VK169_02340 [Saprospiraceae bacterium]|nr:hypothetical protein [Saprospiraceae bacterium]